MLQSGYLRYCGPTEFASGVWAGIELDEPVGKNDGSIGGISYFKCPNNYGKNVARHHKISSSYVSIENYL